MEPDSLAVHLLRPLAEIDRMKHDSRNTLLNKRFGYRLEPFSHPCARYLRCVGEEERTSLALADRSHLAAKRREEVAALPCRDDESNAAPGRGSDERPGALTGADKPHLLEFVQDLHCSEMRDSEPTDNPRDARKRGGRLVSSREYLVLERLDDRSAFCLCSSLHGSFHLPRRL